MVDLVISDLHLTDKPQDEYRWEALYEIPNELSRQGAGRAQIRRVIILGDITENKDRHSEALVNRVIYLFDTWMRIFDDAQFVALAGNHCGITAQRAFFRFMGLMNRKFTYITEPTVRWGELFLPHTRTSDSWANFRPFTRSKYKRIYMHQTVRGATAANSQTLEGMDASIFEDQSLHVYSGDVHTAQTVDNHIHYIGSPYPIDFGDEDGGSFILLNYDTDGMIVIDTPLPKKKRKLHISDDDPVEQLRSIEDFRYPGSMYAVVVHIPQTQLDRLPQIKRDIQEYINSQYCKCVRISAEVTRQTSARRRRRISNTSTPPATVVKRFAQENNLDNYYLETALDIIK